MDLKKKTLAGRLCRAVQDEEPRSVQVLLSQGASANLVGAQGVAAVHLAAGKESEKSVRCLKLLLRHGADPNVRSSEGLTPLHVAALWGCNQNLKLLLANGGDPNVTDQEGNTPGQFAEQQDNRKCAQLLQNHRVQSADLVEDLPRFQNSSDSDQTDIYSYPDSDSSLSSRLSIIGDFAEDPLSSTRHSALFDWPSSSYPHPCSRGGPSSRRMDADPGGGRPSFLSSTRMSTAGGGSAMPVVQEDVVSFRDEDTWAGNAWEGPSLLSCTRMSTAGPVLRDRPVEDHYVEAPAQRVNSHPLGLECRFSIPQRDTPMADMAGPSGQARQRSVRFHEAAEYLPVTSLDEYLPVTSPDHVYAFDRDRDDSKDTEEAELGALESEADFQVDGLEDIAAQEQDVLPFTPSPFVTGRTRSRLSRCSLRTSGTPESSLSTTSLFDESLPMPVRTRRQTPRSQSSSDNVFYNSPHGHVPPKLTGGGSRDLSGSSLTSDHPETLSSSDLSDCEADTFILPRGRAEAGPPLLSLPDTIILERTPYAQTVHCEEPSGDATLQVEDVAGGEQEFMTDDLTSADEKNPQRESEDEGDVVGAEQPGILQNKDVAWITEGSDTNAESGSSSSSSCYIAPKRSREGSSKTPFTPGTTRSTPRYSMSRLTLGLSRSQNHLALQNNLQACTPGRRPFALDLEEEPVEYLYTDTDQGHELIETHIPTTPVYIKRLCRLILESNTPSPQPQHTHLDQSHTYSGYSLELSRALVTFDLPDCHAAELELCQQFDRPDQNKKWREGVIKSSFNYLLLDPRVTKNLPYCSRTMSPHECFQTFVRAVFYVGKGKRSRPYSHLYEALEYFKGVKTSKVQHILQVWSGGQGVISLHCFQNVIPVEAFTREACIVDAIGLKMLTNQKRGDYYGVVSTWQASKRRELGVHLLYRAMLIFLAEGERQLRPADIRQ
ncbi:hypothetical protein NHX12_033445 [Muraenolepis orangiensis]|uniref:Ankyrin repeat and LEM domain-containing protein 1 n=1 Tax=Muraenolepis orangiensis TaxID=630683 RepID=A0A9Q0IHZ5_9TELE|nr:hypothetical protein NHX12_033445 [Muraenolepis orangiensis]